MYSLQQHQNKHYSYKAGTPGNHLAESITRRYVMLPATNPELVAKVQRLRYQVYCVENSFEDPARFPDRREHDEFDSHAIQGLLYDRKCMATAGTVRMILPRPGESGFSLPIQELCHHPLVHDRRLISGSAAEISRFAISKEYRRHVRHHEGEGSPYWTPAAEDPLLTHITLGLAKGLVHMSIKHGISDWFAVMEPALLRLLKRSAIHFTPLGPLVDYHGKRLPCYVNLNAMLRQVRLERPDVWDVIMDR